jgi:hypothetical protein
MRTPDAFDFRDSTGALSDQVEGGIGVYAAL